MSRCTAGPTLLESSISDEAERQYLLVGAVPGEATGRNPHMGDDGVETAGNSLLGGLADDAEPEGATGGAGD